MNRNGYFRNSNFRGRVETFTISPFGKSVRTNDSLMTRELVTLRLSLFLVSCKKSYFLAEFLQIAYYKIFSVIAQPRNHFISEFGLWMETGESERVSKRTMYVQIHATTKWCRQQVLLHLYQTRNDHCVIGVVGGIPYSLQISSPFNFRLEGGENWREWILNP